MRFKIYLFIVSLTIFVVREIDADRNIFQDIQNAIKVAQNEVEIFITSGHITVEDEKIIRIECYNPTTKGFNQIAPLLDPAMPQKLDLTKPIGVLVHGWMDTYDDRWILDTFSAWTQNRDENVCRIDWSYYAQNDYYTTARTNIFIVANYLIKFLSGLSQLYDVPYKNFLLVGHNMGAHICGLIGSGSNDAIGIIIGLDPSGPLFTIPYVIPKKYRLDSDDATIVQVIHTGDGKLGTAINIGKQDFRLNTGFGTQQGCSYPNLEHAYHNDVIRCSHYRSYQIFQSSLINGKNCISIKCTSLLQYLTKQCPAIFDYLGLNTKGIPGTFYLATWDNPVCINQYYLIGNS